MIVETTEALILLLREKILENTVLSAGSIVELAKLPALILNGPTLYEKKKLMRDAERIVAVDLNEGKAIYEVPPRWYDLRFDVSISCNSNREILEIIEKLSRLNQSKLLLIANNNERQREYSWVWRVMAGADVTPNISQVFQAKGEIVIYDVEIYSEIREIWPLIEKVIVDIDKDKIEVE